MTGLFFLWLAIGGGCLFLCVLAFAAIEEMVRERRLRLEAGVFAQARRRPAPGKAAAEAEPVAALRTPIIDIAA